MDNSVIATAIACDRVGCERPAQIAHAMWSHQVDEDASKGASITGELSGDGTDLVRNWAIHIQAAGAQRIAATARVLAEA